MNRIGLLSLLTTGILLALLTGQAAAATFTVANTDDSGPGSLRDAIAQANSTNGNDVVNFDPALFANPRTIQLNSFLVIDPTQGNDALTIDGPGANVLTVRAPAAGGPALDIPDGNNNVVGGITFQGTTTPQFLATVNSNASNVLLDGVVITGNTSDAGGNGSGGGLIVFGGDLTIRNSTVSNNTVNNVGPIGGGGGILSGDTLTLVNTTVSGNTVRGTGTNQGGGIVNFGGDLRLVNATVANNTVEHGGGGILTNGGQALLANSILAVNSGDAGDDIAGTNFTSQGHNLIGTTTGGTVAAMTGDQFGTDAAPINPMLETLSVLGGTTPTLALQDGSPAIDGGDPNNSDAAFPGPPALVPSPTTDQRGVARPQGPGNDIGAFEVVPNNVLISTVQLDKDKGTATISVEVFAPGLLGLSGNGIKPQRPAAGRSAKDKPVSGPGIYKLKVKPTGGKKKKLKKKGKVKVTALVTFTPDNGTSNTETKKITLKRK